MGGCACGKMLNLFAWCLLCETSTFHANSIFGGKPEQLRMAHSSSRLHGVTCFSEVDEERGSRRLFLSHQLVAAPGNEHHVAGRARRVATVLCVEDYVLTFAVVTQARGDELE